MQITVLGCAGSMTAGHHTTAFLVDEVLLVDAGSGVGTLTVEAMQRIDHVLLSHAHLDHVLGLPLLADAVLRHRSECGLGPIHVHALPETLAVLKDHLFNHRLWPDFTRLPTADGPILQLHPLHIGEQRQLGPYGVWVLPARHVVPCAGYAIWQGASMQSPTWAYSGDTGPNPEIWPLLQRLPDLRHWVMEVAFSDQDAELARVSGHHCPASLDEALRELPATTQVHLTHLKPGEWPAVQADLQRRGFERPLRPLSSGQRFTL